MEAAHSQGGSLLARKLLWKLLLLGVLCLEISAICDAQTWIVSWSDEFNGAANSPIDTSNWQYETGILKVNNEVEYYCAPGSSTPPCDPGTSNTYIDGKGHLVIQAIRNNPSVVPYSASWTSARLNTGNDLQKFSVWAAGIEYCASRGGGPLASILGARQQH
jgi:hypothetical protein